MFITFEGVEGCGKSSVLTYVFNELQKEKYNIMETREPGGVKISEEIRKIVLGKAYMEMDKRTEALLFAASRRQHLVEKVWPALKENKIVLCDRFLDSSLAYQGGGDGLGVDEVLKVNLFATENTYPDYTILFDIDPRVGLARINKNNNREVNRLDIKELEFYDTVRKTYLELAKKYKDRYIIIDASKDFNTVANNVLNIIKEKINGLH
ncbi:MAG: dTMP kinase [Bacilli bacterium]|jgi:dTMP kinase